MLSIIGLMGVGLRLRLLLVLLVGCWGLEQTAAAGADGAPQSTAAVGTAAQFLAALEDPNVATIAVVKPISMPHGRFKPAVVERQLLVTSPHREMIDWCNEQCRNGSMPRTPFIILGKVSSWAVGILLCYFPTALHLGSGDQYQPLGMCNIMAMVLFS